MRSSCWGQLEPRYMWSILLNLIIPNTERGSEPLPEVQQKQCELRVKSGSPREASGLRFFSSWNRQPWDNLASRPCNAALACGPPASPLLFLSHQRWKAPSFLDQGTWPHRTRVRRPFPFWRKKFKLVVRLRQISVSYTKFSVLASICSHLFMLESRKKLSDYALIDFSILGLIWIFQCFVFGKVRVSD